MPSHQIRSMRHRGPGNHPDDHGRRKQEPKVLRLEATVAKQRRDERRLHAEPSIEQGVEHDESYKRRRFHHAWRIAARSRDVLAIERIQMRLLIVRQTGRRARELA